MGFVNWWKVLFLLGFLIGMVGDAVYGNRDAWVLFFICVIFIPFIALAEYDE
jgi:hypothetical protein